MIFNQRIYFALSSIDIVDGWKNALPIILKHNNNNSYRACSHLFFLGHLANDIVFLLYSLSPRMIAAMRPAKTAKVIYELSLEIIFMRTFLFIDTDGIRSAGMTNTAQSEHNIFTAIKFNKI